MHEFRGYSRCEVGTLGRGVLFAPPATAVGEVRFAAPRGRRTTAVDEDGRPEVEAFLGHLAAERIRRG